MRKILFNDKYGLTQAVLKGRKTMTRRIACFKEIKRPESGFLVEGADSGKLVLCDGGRILTKSTYKCGEILAVSQSFRTLEKEIQEEGLPLEIKNTCRNSPGWSNKLFVKSDLMPHQIRITNIRVERLQDITEGNCLHEGVVRYTCNLYEFQGVCYSYEGDKNKMGTYKTAREAFASLFDKISGKGTWDKNPWVFVYEFELVK